ncbi:MAG TPA: hypothetical protein VF801_11520 [Rhodocyclaceae bacterium]
MTAALRRRWRTGAAGIALLALALPGWWFDRTAFLAAWLTAWCFCAWIAMGGLATLWMHALTGGGWGEAVRAPLTRAAGLLPLLSVLFLPVLLGLRDLYPWATAPRGWEAELSAPAFKDAWLQPGFFAARSIAVLLLWNLLAWAARREERLSVRLAATSAILYALSVGVASADWLMSLSPLWYSSIFGLQAAAAQALAGLAFAAFVAASRNNVADRQTKRDIGNLLLTWVLAWGYLAFCQYLIIWAENLPHEILWYEQRRALPWPPLGIAVALLQFGVPFLALLFREIKDSSSHLATVAVVLLGAHLLALCWLILPSVAHLQMRHEWWLLPLCVAGFSALCVAALPAEEAARG